MRNLKKALSLALALVMLLGMMMVGAGAAPKFEDVPDGAANQEAIEVMNALQIIKGDENGFRPDDTLLRAEAAVIISRVLLTPAVVEKLSGTQSSFTDVANYEDGWAVPYVEACALPGIIAGNGDGTFGPGDKLTGTAFAKMLLVTIGFDPDSYNGKSNWEMLVLQDAIKAGLDANDVPVTSGYLSRANAAQMAFNALLYSPTGEKTYRVGNLSFDNFLEAYIAAGQDVDKISTSTASDSLAKTRFNLSQRDGADKYGRMTKEWVVNGKSVYSTSIGAITYTSKQTDLKNALGSYKFAENAEKIVDGNKGVAIDSKSKPDEVIQELTGNGTIVDVYASNKVISKVVVINQYVGTVTAVTEARGTAKRSITVSGASKKFPTEDFAVGDVVVYTKLKDDINEIALADVIENVEITKTVGDNGATSFTADGADHHYAKTTTDTKGYVVVGAKLNLYLDSYGYVVHTSEIEGVSSYAYVIDTGMDAGRYGSDNSFYAKLLLADGTVVEAQLNKTDYNSFTAATVNDTVKNWLNTNFKGHIVEATKNDKDIYKLTDKSGIANETVKTDDADVTITGGQAKMTLGSLGTVYADSKTIFLVEAPEKTYTVYVGYDEVPNLTADDAASYSVARDGNVANVVYLKGVTTSSRDIVFVLGSECSETPIRISGSNSAYYECPAVVNGEIVTVRLDEAIEANKLYSTITYSDKTNEIIDISACDEYATSTDSPSYRISGTVNKALTNGNLTIGSTSYRVADDVEVFLCKDGTISESSVGSIVSTTELKDEVLFAVVSEGKIVAIFYKEGEAAKTPTPVVPVEIPDGEVKVNVTAVITGSTVVFKANGTAAEAGRNDKIAALTAAIVAADKTVSADKVTVSTRPGETATKTQWVVKVDGEDYATFLEDTDNNQNIEAGQPDKNAQLKDVENDETLSDEVKEQYNDLINGNYVDNNAKFETNDDGSAIKVTPSKWTRVSETTEVPAYGTGPLVELYTWLTAMIDDSDTTVEYAVVSVADPNKPEGEQIAFKMIFKVTTDEATKYYKAAEGETEDEFATSANAGDWHVTEGEIFYTPANPAG